jgi:hypothetical protein
MKKLLFGLALSLASTLSFSQEYKLITTIESVVPGGLGRSRMIQTGPDGELREDKMKNFFSMAGINFGNVIENDRMITDMLTSMKKEGWKLESITPGVYAADKSTGIFITRYLFSKEEMEE